MIRLDTTTLSLEAILAGAVTTNQLQCYVTYSDSTSTDYVGGSKRTLTNGVTAVTICTAPGASVVRDIDYVNIYNNDTVAASLVVRLNDNGTFYTLRDVTLNQDDCLTYTHAKGWYVTDVSGSIKELLSGSVFSNISVTGVETDTAVGTQKVISQDASKFREAQQSTLTSGTAYTTNGSLLIMKAFLHNTGIDTSGNFTAADATDYCSALIYSEDDKIKGFGSAAAVTGGTTPTLSNTWYLDNITGNQWINGTFTQGDTTAIGGLVPLCGMFSSNTGAGSNIIIRKSVSATNAAILSGVKSRGTSASPSIITTGDGLFGFTAYGFDGTNYVLSGRVDCLSEGTIGTGIIPSRWSFSTSNSAGTVTEALRIDSAQTVTVVAPSGLGYGTGSGGTVTQATSKSTTVTLNKPSGQITMNNAALGAGVEVGFQVNNSMMTTTDNITASITALGGVANAGVYRLKWVTGVAGLFYLYVKNESAGSLSESVVIDFKIIKGATA